MPKNAKTISNILSKKSKHKYKFFFVGIGGISMYALALFIKSLGQEVEGSDTKKSDNVKMLIQNGVRVHSKHCENNIQDFDFVVYSFAVENNVEVKKAKELKICTISRTELLCLILNIYKTSICVSGAHGKTTTTALIYTILKCAGKNPGLHLGGFLKDEQFSSAFTNGDICVCEACEYKDAFLKLSPSIAVVLNTAPEHLDYFKTYENVKKSFCNFGKNADMLICESKQSFLYNQKMLTFGSYPANFYAKNIVTLADGTSIFDCYKDNNYYARIHINLIGKHNVNNALCAICVCDSLSVSKEDIKTALDVFGGVQRRFEVLKKNPLIISDYAHHPDEINAVIDEFTNFYHKNLLIVFQPHTYSRTALLKNEFAKCFGGREVIIYKTFSAREKYKKAGSAKSLCDAIGPNSIFIKSENDLKKTIIGKINQGYSVIFLGAGNLDKIAKNIANMC